MVKDEQIIEALHADIARYTKRIARLEGLIAKWAVEIQEQARILHNEVSARRRRNLKPLSNGS